MQFIDLHKQRERIKDEINASIARVMEHGQYILGPEVKAFEAALSEYGRAKYVLSCANGTDAIILALKAWNIGPGDAVFCPSFTYVATAEAIALLGATPIFIDIDRAFYTACPTSLHEAIEAVKAKGELVPRAFISVDLFGQSADYRKLAPVCREFDLKIIADSAQAFGCTLDNHHPLHWADVTTTSFFPAKPLGCYGDGGALLTNDADMASIVDSLRVHGKGDDKYDNVRIGLNSRLDTLQAAILLEKLKIFDDELMARQNIAARYKSAFENSGIITPAVIDGGTSTWAIYTVQVPNRDQFIAAMSAANIPTPAYYPKPAHRQSAYQHYPLAPKGLPNTETLRHHVVALPMHPYLSAADQDFIIKTALQAIRLAA